VISFRQTIYWIDMTTILTTAWTLGSTYDPMTIMYGIRNCEQYR
jgi:hypothetical protein